jgi:nicotinate-nucleotide adenylyltransferase
VVGAVLEGATGIFGGTFDPVHLGHVAVARQVRDDLGLARVLLVPSFRPPHRDQPSAGADDRLEMVRRAVGAQPGLEVDDVEVRRKGTSYAVDTLRELRRTAPDRELVLLLGHDAAREFSSWHQAGAIGELARVAVFNRAGAGPADGLEDAGLPLGTIHLVVDSPDISATGVRAALSRGEDLSHMLPASVLEYIRERGLYSVGA